jgi:hypothetical protein
MLSEPMCKVAMVIDTEEMHDTHGLIKVRCLTCQQHGPILSTISIITGTNTCCGYEFSLIYIIFSPEPPLMDLQKYFFICLDIPYDINSEKETHFTAKEGSSGLIYMR